MEDAAHLGGRVYAAFSWCCKRRFSIVTRLTLSLCRGFLDLVRCSLAGVRLFRLSSISAMIIALDDRRRFWLQIDRNMISPANEVFEHLMQRSILPCVCGSHGAPPT